jgi:hypothetical protein
LPPKRESLIPNEAATNKRVQGYAALNYFPLFFRKIPAEEIAKSLRKKAGKLNARSGTALYTRVSTN